MTASDNTASISLIKVGDRKSTSTEVLLLGVDGKLIRQSGGQSLLWREAIFRCSHTLNEETFCSALSKSMYYFLPFSPQQQEITLVP